MGKGASLERSARIAPNLPLPCVRRFAVCKLGGRILATMLAGWLAVGCGDDAPPPNDGGVSCPQGQIKCDGRCVDPATDRGNCGGCGNVCGTNATCESGVCRLKCPTGEVNCFGKCVNLKNDRDFCGSCKTRCDTNQLCDDGTCETACGPGRVRSRGLPAGDCKRLADGTVVCSCCDEPGRDPDTQCDECDNRYHERSDYGPADLDSFAITPLAEQTAALTTACDPNQTCDDLDCGEHGVCVDTATGDPPGNTPSGDVACECEAGYAGEECDDCGPLFEEFGEACVPSDDCDEELCNGHGQCEQQPDGTLECDCDDGFENPDDESCGDGPDMRIGGPVESVLVGGLYELGIELRNGAHCTTDFVWTVISGNGLVFPQADTHFADFEIPFTTDPLFEYTEVRAECGNNPELFDVWTQTVITTSALGVPGASSLGGWSRAEFGPIDDAMTNYMLSTQLEGGAIAITYLDQLVYLRAYGVRDLAESEPMLTCTPMRVASVTKPFTRAAMINGVYGQPIPANLGGGTLQANTPVVPILTDVMNLGAGNTLSFEAPATLYAMGFIGPTCNVGSGTIDPGWLGVNPGNLLNHTSGLAPNQQYRFNMGFGPCTGAVTEICGNWANVFDPTVSPSNTTSIANVLGLGQGVVDADDVIQYMAGVCLYDNPASVRFRYSNFGFTVAGRVMELVTGQAWSQFIPTFTGNLGISGTGIPGSPVLYQGSNDGVGPFSEPWLEESQYYSFIGNMTDVTQAQDMGGVWTFPDSVPAPYGGYNYDLMYAHGGMTANVLALSNFMREFIITSGVARAPMYNAFPAGSQEGRLPGVQSTIRSFDGTQPANNGNPNGAGCLVPEFIAGAAALNNLDVEPCPIPSGINVAILFNREFPTAGNFPSFVNGLHNNALLRHVIQAALSDIGTTAADWGAIQPLGELERQVGCNLKCPAEVPYCVPITCGDGNLDSDEECDDGNNEAGDGCGPDCMFPPPPPQMPPGYDDCEGEDPGTCLGGPCAPVEDLPTVTQLLEWRSEAHPDGDFSPDQFCLENFHNGDYAWEEAVCVRESYGANNFGVCRECGVDTLIGCICPNNVELDGGCNPGGLGDPLLTCIGERCYPEAPGSQPSWMCTARCDTIYGNNGYCHHDGIKGAVCYDYGCSEPVDTWCDETAGAVCDNAINDCLESECCTPECLSTQDCIDLGYVGHVCNGEDRCVL